jgi:hypothetical protein
MKVLFLDIDGVVNCLTTKTRYLGLTGIDPRMAGWCSHLRGVRLTTFVLKLIGMCCPVST